MSLDSAKPGEPPKDSIRETIPARTRKIQGRENARREVHKGPACKRSIVSTIRGTLTSHKLVLCTPANLGQAIKPFVSLEHELHFPGGQPPGRPWPCSGMAILSVVLSGVVSYEDTTGNRGDIAAGDVALLNAGNGAWRATALRAGSGARMFHVGIALPRAGESLPARSRLIPVDALPQEGCARVILGRLDDTQGVIEGFGSINVFQVRLRNGQRWQYSPPPGHIVSWVAVDRGRLCTLQTVRPEGVGRGELAIFEEVDGGMIALRSEGVTSFIFGSSKKHPFPLVWDRFSVHTKQGTMKRAKERIASLGRELLAQGRIR